MPVAIIPAVIAGVSAIAKMAHGIHQNNLAKKVVVPDANYADTGNKQLATQMFNAEMPGAEEARRNIQSNNANTMQAVGRNATDSSQALGVDAGAQAQTDQSFQNLALQEGQYKFNMLNNLQGVNDKDYQDKVRMQNLKLQEKGSLRGAATANIGAGMNEITAASSLAANALNKP